MHKADASTAGSFQRSPLPCYAGLERFLLGKAAV